MGILYLISYVLDILGEYLSARLKVMQQNILEKKQALFTAATIICSCRNSVCVLFNFIVWTTDKYVDDHCFSSWFKISWEISARDFKKRLWKVKIF